MLVECDPKRVLHQLEEILYAFCTIVAWDLAVY